MCKCVFYVEDQKHTGIIKNPNGEFITGYGNMPVYEMKTMKCGKEKTDQSEDMVRDRYTYKSDSQVIMLTLAKLLDINWEEKSLRDELSKRGNEQRGHIPYHVRNMGG